MLGKTSYLLLFIFIILIIIPVILVKGIFWKEKEKDLLVKVYNHHQDKIITMELTDYLRGVVAAEMPAVYHFEALKAQAVAARTYTLKQLPFFGGTGSKEYPGADICTDYHYSQAWLSEEEMKKKWGFIPFFYYWAKVSRAVDKSRGEVLTYDGKLIDAVYHANSGGKTEDASYVWGRETPYLRSVISLYDQEGKKNFKDIYRFNFEEIAKKLNLNVEELFLEKNKNDINVEILKRSASDRVLEIRIGNKNFLGIELRQKLNLPSNKFEIALNGDMIEFTVWGKGHGAGMSQDGANGYANHGYNYQNILKHYYSGAKLIKIDDLKP